VALDQVRFDAKDTIAEATEVAVPAGVGALSCAMIPAIDLDHEARGRRQEVHDGFA
jgi:hypothetical protein